MARLPARRAQHCWEGCDGCGVAPTGLDCRALLQRRDLPVGVGKLQLDTVVLAYSCRKSRTEQLADLAGQGDCIYILIAERVAAKQNVDGRLKLTTTDTTLTFLMRVELGWRSQICLISITLISPVLGSCVKSHDAFRSLSCCSSSSFSRLMSFLAFATSFFAFWMFPPRIAVSRSSRLISFIVRWLK